MDTQLAKPKGLLKRGNSYFFQARIPKKYSEHFPKSLIQEKLPTDSYAEAVRIVLQKWVDLNKKFTLIDSISATPATNQLASTITLEAMHSIVDRWSVIS